MNRLREDQISGGHIEHGIIGMLTHFCICHILLQLINDVLVEHLRLPESILVQNKALFILILQLEVGETH